MTGGINPVNNSDIMALILQNQGMLAPPAPLPGPPGASSMFSLMNQGAAGATDPNAQYAAAMLPGMTGVS